MAAAFSDEADVLFPTLRKTAVSGSGRPLGGLDQEWGEPREKRALDPNHAVRSCRGHHLASALRPGTEPSSIGSGDAGRSCPHVGSRRLALLQGRSGAAESRVDCYTVTEENLEPGFAQRLHRHDDHAETFDVVEGASIPGRSADHVNTCVPESAK